MKNLVSNEPGTNYCARKRLSDARNAEPSSFKLQPLHAKIQRLLAKNRCIFDNRTEPKLLRRLNQNKWQGTVFPRKQTSLMRNEVVVVLRHAFFFSCYNHQKCMNISFSTLLLLNWLHGSPFLVHVQNKWLRNSILCTPYTKTSDFLKEKLFHSNFKLCIYLE